MIRRYVDELINVMPASALFICEIAKQIKRPCAAEVMKFLFESFFAYFMILW